MTVDKATIMKIISLDDNTFKKKVTDAAKANNLDSAQLQRALQDVGKLKTTLSALPEGELQKIVTLIGGEHLHEVLAQLGKSI